MDWKKQLKERMSSYSEPAGDGLWESIESGLDGVGVHRPAAWIWPLAGAAAAVVAALLLIPRETAVEPEKTLVADASTIDESHETEIPVNQVDTPFEEILVAEALPATPPVSSSVASVFSPIQKATAEIPVQIALVERPSLGRLASLTELPSHRLATGAGTIRRQAEKVGEDDFPVFPDDWDDVTGFRPSFSLGLNGLMGLSASSREDGFGTSSQSMRTVRKSAALNAEYADLALRNRPTTDEENHSLAARFGVEFDLRFAPSWSVGTGLFYSSPQSRFRSGSATNYVITRQTLGYVGIPLHVKYDFLTAGGFRFYAKAGGAGETCVYNSSGRTYYSGDKAYDGENLSGNTKTPIQWSLGAAAGAELTFLKHFSIYAEPSFNWYIPSGSELKSVYTEKPFSPGLSAGIRFTLDR